MPCVGLQARGARTVEAQHAAFTSRAARGPANQVHGDVAVLALRVPGLDDRARDLHLLIAEAHDAVGHVLADPLLSARIGHTEPHSDAANTLRLDLRDRGRRGLA